MKNSNKLMVALAVTLILSLVSLSVWAAPGRMGTIPTPPLEVDLITDEFVTLGTFEVSASVVGTATRVEDPESDMGPAPDGLYFLSDAVTFELEEEGNITVCYPYPQWVKDQKGDIYKWDEVTEEWVVVDSTVSGDPPMICFTDEGVTGGSYSLLGG
jgi:hypothetical protein